MVRAAILLCMFEQTLSAVVSLTAVFWLSTAHTPCCYLPKRSCALFLASYLQFR